MAAQAAGCRGHPTHPFVPGSTTSMDVGVVEMWYRSWRDLSVVSLVLHFRAYMVTSTTHHYAVIEQMAFMYEVATRVGLQAL